MHEQKSVDKSLEEIDKSLDRSKHLKPPHTARRCSIDTRQALLSQTEPGVQLGSPPRYLAPMTEPTKPQHTVSKPLNHSSQGIQNKQCTTASRLLKPGQTRRGTPPSWGLSLLLRSEKTPACCSTTTFTAPVNLFSEWWFSLTDLTLYSFQHFEWEARKKVNKKKEVISSDDQILNILLFLS